MGYSDGPARPQVQEQLPVITPKDREQLLTGLLRGVSRAFYLSMRVLPGGLREPIGLAYLLARAADTVADTRVLPPGERLRHLMAFRSQVEGPAAMVALRKIGSSLTDQQLSPGERELLLSLPEVFSALASLPQGDRDGVRYIVLTLTRGMEIDLTTFPAEDSGQIAALKDWSELDRYVYYAAGCVGEFWTAITMGHTSALEGWDVKAMSETGVRFGKALQMTNVLRDVPRDLRIGRCYLPETELARVGVRPEDLLKQSAGTSARPVLVEGTEIALAHYSAAEEYLLAIPRRCVRLRLAALWPILIGLATLGRLASNKAWLDPEQPSKVSRSWVYRMLAFSAPSVHSNGVLRAWIARLREGVKTAL